MRSASRAPTLCLLIWSLVGAACAGDVGAPCREVRDCPSGLCLGPGDGFPGGYCSSSCDTRTCAAGQSCRAVNGRPVCLLRCEGGCRPGYQCFQGLCQPPCRTDTDCGPGNLCQAGACAPRPGAPVGADCDEDTQCASGACAGGLCARTCERDGDCGAGETCALDRAAETVRGLCVERRGGVGPLGACLGDSACDRGSCLMGACLLLCQTPQDCDGDQRARSCTGLPAPLRSLPAAEWPEARVCLPRNQTFSAVVRTPLLVPRTARSVLLFSAVPGCDEEAVVGFGSVQVAGGMALYRWPSDENIYLQNPIRALPDVGCSSMLLSSSPTRAPVGYGTYNFQSVAQAQRGGTLPHEVRAFYKLLDAPQRRGRVPLRIHITDLSGLPAGCSYRTLTAQSAPTRLDVFVRRLRDVFQQETVGLTLDPVTFMDSNAASSVDAADRSTLHAVLRAASRDTSGGLDLVLVRSISPGTVLGVAGGIPASPGLPDTPHTGAVVSVYPLCIAQARQTQETYALVAGHELGHTMGLSHNREQNGQPDPLGDGTGPSESAQQEERNLMYWNAQTYGNLLTEEQGTVLRSMPQVLP